MSGRGGGGRGRGGRGGFGGRGAPVGPVARDEDGTVLPTAPAGPPPLFPEIELPEHPDISAKDKMLLLRRFEMTHRSKVSPYFLELQKTQTDTGALDSGFDPYRPPVAALQAGAGGALAAAAAADGAAGANGTAPAAAPVAAPHGGGGVGVGSKRGRPPLSSIMTLIPDYFPEELYTTKDMRASRLQTLKGQDAYFQAQTRGGNDASSLKRLEQLAKLESNQEEGGGGPGGRKGAEGEEEEGAEEEVPHDTDEEEDMEDDDYYQGEHFDDDEGYGDADEGGDDGPVY